jgi:hypothetical protein
MPRIEIAIQPTAGADEPPKRSVLRRAEPYWRSYEFIRSKEDALDAAAYVSSWLDDLGAMDLGHEGNHAVDEVRKNVRALSSFLRHRSAREAA